MKFSKKILETFIKLPVEWQDLMEDVGLEVKSLTGDNFTLELLANRGDHYCYAGLAREISGRTGDSVNMPALAEINEKLAEVFEIKTDKCLAFSLTPYKFTKHIPTDSKRAYMLSASGVNVIHPAIDITNVVMLELGQPAHIYDLDKIVGKMVIRETNAGEQAALLFHEGMTELPAGTIVISDDEKILCVAGVIGCRAAGVDENSRNIGFETALFDPVSIRKTAKSLGVSSIASQRFERGGDMNAVHLGARRAAALYPASGWEQAGDMQFALRNDIPKQFIKMPGDFVRGELEINITDAEIDERLARYGFVKTESGYETPAHRIWDIKGYPADLVEELCRSVGYNALPSRLPHVEIGAEIGAAEIRKDEVAAYLINNGFFEVITDNMYSPKHAALSPVKEHINLENSVDGGYAHMRNNTIVQAAELVDKNLRVKNMEIKAFEWGKVFTGDCAEISVLWGVMNGRGLDALDAKGLLAGMGLKSEIAANAADFPAYDFLSPARRGVLTLDNETIGIYGEMHPSLLAAFDIKGAAPVYFEILTDELLGARRGRPAYVKPPKVALSERDITISVPYGKPAQEIANELIGEGVVMVSCIISNVYDKPAEKARNITYTLTFKEGLSTEEINDILTKILGK